MFDGILFVNVTYTLENKSEGNRRSAAHCVAVRAVYRPTRMSMVDHTRCTGCVKLAIKIKIKQNTEIRAGTRRIHGRAKS